MPTIFLKNFLKCLPTTTLCPQSFTLEPQPENLTTTTTTASIIIDNSNNLTSLYDSSSASASTSKSLTFSSSESIPFDEHDEPLPDFSTIFASQRFFFTSPGVSNSIIHSPDKEIRKSMEVQIQKILLKNLDSEPTQPLPFLDSVAIKKYSPDPYTDFKHSMQEMIESRGDKPDWNYLNELLSCYLALNPRHTHKVIISAFADIVISLLCSSPESGIQQTEDNCRRQEHEVVSHWFI